MVWKFAVHGQSLWAGQLNGTVAPSARFPLFNRSIEIEPSEAIELGLCAVPEATEKPLASTETVPDPVIAMPYRAS